MATDTSTTTKVESGGNQQSSYGKVFQHIGVLALVGSFQVVYSTFIVVANEVFSQASVDLPQWFEIVVQTGTGIPVVVVLALTANYTVAAITGKEPVDWWRITAYAAAIGLLALPVMNYINTPVGPF